MTSTQHVSTPVSPAIAITPQRSYNYALGYLRGFIVMLVVAHHAALAYHPYVPPIPTSLTAVPRLWQAFPVIDPQRGAWSALLVGFNDIFFMSLLFLLSGLFVASGIKSKGASHFLRGRLLRLGAPFLVAAALLAPLAYYSSYLQINHHSNVPDFTRQWLSLGKWPSGPAWFLWVLFVFDAMAAALFALSPRWAEGTGHFLAGAKAKPVRFFALLLLASSAAYVPLAVLVNGLSWSAFGPFAFQTARIFHYLLYFLAGVSLGAWGIERGPLMSNGKLAARWPLWVVVSLLTFLISTSVTIAFFTTHLHSKAWEVVSDLAFPLSCAASCFAFLAVFLRFTRTRSRFFDSLNRNSYGIYLLHYAFVSWLQLAMVATPLPSIAKFAVVFSLALAGSWFTVIALRRIPAIDRIV